MLIEIKRRLFLESLDQCARLAVFNCESYPLTYSCEIRGNDIKGELLLIQKSRQSRVVNQHPTDKCISQPIYFPRIAHIKKLNFRTKIMNETVNIRKTKRGKSQSNRQRTLSHSLSYNVIPLPKEAAYSNISHT